MSEMNAGTSKSAGNLPVGKRGGPKDLAEITVLPRENFMEVSVSVKKV
jgi:hypothetical protein